MLSVWARMRSLCDTSLCLLMRFLALKMAATHNVVEFSQLSLVSFVWFLASTIAATHMPQSEEMHIDQVESDTLGACMLKARVAACTKCVACRLLHAAGIKFK
jgi:hypothetical protein